MRMYSMFVAGNEIVILGFRFDRLPCISNIYLRFTQVTSVDTTDNADCTAWELWNEYNAVERTTLAVLMMLMDWSPAVSIPTNNRLPQYGVHPVLPPIRDLLNGVPPIQQSPLLDYAPGNDQASGIPGLTQEDCGTLSLLKEKFAVFNNSHVPRVLIPIDPLSWIQGRLWEELKDKPFSEWLELHYYRKSERLAYAHKTLETYRHVLELDSNSHSASGLKSVFEDDLADSEMPKEDEHKNKEKERRIRHAFLQGELDLECSEFDFEFAEKMMPALKRYLKQKQLKHCRSNEKRLTGKDEQLSATNIRHIMSHWIFLYLFHLFLMGSVVSTTASRYGFANVASHRQERMVTPPPSPSRSLRLDPDTDTSRIRVFNV